MEKFRVTNEHGKKTMPIPPPKRKQKHKQKQENSNNNSREIIPGQKDTPLLPLSIKGSGEYRDLTSASK